MTSGFFVVDKERGPTSHDVVAGIRRITGIRKAGHAGTLDPMATGIVIVAVGRATRLIRFLQDLPKEYVAEAAFGIATDTLDADGAIVSREPMDVTADDVERVLERFRGRILQVPPMVSALKVNGRRLYELAREGVEVERQARPVDIYELELLDVAPGPYPEVRFRVVCGKGTYVRTLADDIAAALGGRAHLTSLRRTRVGSITVEEAHPLSDLEGRWEQMLVSPASGLRDLPAVTVGPDTAKAVSHGIKFARSPAPEVPDGVPFRVLDGQGRMLAVYRAAGEKAVPEVVLA